MLFAAHGQALYDALVNDPVDPFNNIFAHSRLSVTEGILEAYENEFCQATDRHLLMSFISGLGSRLKVSEPSAPWDSDPWSHYIYSAHVGGKILAVREGAALSAPCRELLDQLGIRIGPIPAVFDDTCEVGYEPFERFRIREGENTSPAVLGRFFCGAKNVTFYDKYINERSIDFIQSLSSCMSPESKVLVITSRQGMPPTDIVGSLRRVPPQVSAAIADRATTERFHDRHVFVDRTYQLHVGRGLDLFGRSPHWRNSNGEVCVYDCTNGESVEFSFCPDRGSSRRPLTLRAVVVA